MMISLPGQTDFDLEHFHLAQDLDDVVPVLKEIIQVTRILN